ncbi:MAG: hypothetical protein VB948_10000 [Pseudomonadales bacterium]
MKKIFRPKEFTAVADGTQVSAFLNATDTTPRDEPTAELDQISIAAGRITPGSSHGSTPTRRSPR